MANEKKQKAITALKAVAGVALSLALIFGSAGTWRWPEAWIFFGLYLTSLATVFRWLKKNDPGLFKERTSRRGKKNVKTWDKIILRVYTALLVVLIVATGLDAVRYRWTRVPLALKFFAFLGFVPAGMIMFWAMRENTFLSETVRIQQERGHRVCTTGPYHFVRHPMYLGIILFYSCLPLALGSFYGLIPAGLIIMLFILRTHLEDRTLRKELPGYEEYAKQVRYKLLPSVW